MQFSRGSICYYNSFFVIETCLFSLFEWAVPKQKTALTACHHITSPSCRCSCQGVWMRCWLIPKNWPEAWRFSLFFFAMTKRAPTLPETNSSPLKIGHPQGKLVFQPSIFRCENVSLPECSCVVLFFCGITLPPSSSHSRGSVANGMSPFRVILHWTMIMGFMGEMVYYLVMYHFGLDVFGWASLKSQTLKMWRVYIQFLFGNEMPEKQTIFFFKGSSMFLFLRKWTKNHLFA